MLTNLREQWFSNVRADILSGLVVGLALIPEAIAFSIIAGVDPQIGKHPANTALPSDPISLNLVPT
ncbi:SulP family inorganic anion transporter [Acinetobacter baumannii]|nr:SulP family inorganic anion transporter [Acinetobacter baumannii]WBS77223.1 SulP family inorganic anion transporter [Acinetobacter baumannii]WBS83490.1 SulP family inorganic anion transporter [Acinetobacter baumannii]WBS84590.1 SulP family inorganic anion transporter [Acinetobacter baumannii]WBS90999.1 SulP family inorganic anion transporter [Acinetobacter baumannii]WBS94556.1 SulP family inorganic anion transporter [Acinetobacter baumannii]